MVQFMHLTWCSGLVGFEAIHADVVIPTDVADEVLEVGVLGLVVGAAEAADLAGGVTESSSTASIRSSIIRSRALR
jgi:hypothetical protein